jgi:hypothetical protein
VHLGDRHRRRTAGNASRHPLGTADGPQRVKLILDRWGGVHRGISFPLRRTPGKGGGVPHSMQQPWCSRGAGAISSTRSLNSATFHPASPICVVAAAFNGDQRSQVVHCHRGPLLLYAGANADPEYGRLHLPSAGHLLSQHSRMWDERSSPPELIHPADLPSISSTTSSTGDSILLLR